MGFLHLTSPFQRNSSTPLVTTQAATSVTSTTATGNGTVVFDHGSTITERGFVLNTIGNPTTSDSKVNTAGTTGDYTGSITGLSGGTTYYYRAYAINAFGTGYGDIWFIVTSAGGGGGGFSWMLMGMGQ